MEETGDNEKAAREKRDADIARRRAAGETLQEIAVRHGLTRERVRQLLEHSGVSKDQAVEARRESLLAEARRHTEELRRRYREGEPMNKSARALGLHAALAREVLEPVLTPADRACRTASSGRLIAAQLGRTPDERLLEGIRACATDGKAPPSGQYAEYAKRVGLPGPQTVAQRFGTWLSAVEAAGLSPQTRSGGGSRRRWDEERCRAAALIAVREFGRWPTVDEYEELSRGRDELPCAATLRNRLGAWSKLGVEMTVALEQSRG